MNQKIYPFLILFLLIPFTQFGQTDWYVSPNGTNSLSNNNGTSESNPLETINFAISNAWQSGDRILVMNGTYRNSGYGNGSLNNGAVVSLNFDIIGEPDGWLIIKNAPGHSPKIQFDGAGGFIGNNEYLEISGFEIEGPNQQITHAQALANRLFHDKYFSGRGIAIWNGHHIYIHDNVVHDCPNSGIRVNNGDYCTVDKNEVYNCTWWASSAESAIVFAQAQAIDTKDEIKMVMTNNLVYDNYNTIPFYNGSASGYGSAAQDYIIDGSGCYVTRNRDTYFYGWFYFANNVCYGNGINGLVVHKTHRAIVTNNTCYLNGAVPLSSGRQSAAGITVNGSSNVRLYNNISWTRFNSDHGYKVYDWPNSQNLMASSNILGKGKSDLNAAQYTFTDPLFMDTLNRDFRILAGSPAIDGGVWHPDFPMYDFNGYLRDTDSPDIGAYEWGSITSDFEVLEKPSILVYPNPTDGLVYLEGEIEGLENLKVYNLVGEDVTNLILINNHSDIVSLDLDRVQIGIYILKSKTSVIKIWKF
jgi:parallel beta-helix repeat protein